MAKKTTTTAIQLYLEIVCSYAKMIQFKDANSLNSKIKVRKKEENFDTSVYSQKQFTKNNT